MSLVGRIKRIVELSKYEPEQLELTHTILDKVKEEKPQGKANGAFLEDMTESEYADWERENDLGWKAFTDKVRNIINPSS